MLPSKFTSRLMKGMLDVRMAGALLFCHGLSKLVLTISNQVEGAFRQRKANPSGAET